MVLLDETLIRGIVLDRAHWSTTAQDLQWRLVELKSNEAVRERDFHELSVRLHL